MTTRKSGPDREGPSSGVGVGLILCKQVKNVDLANVTVLSGRVECRWWESSQGNWEGCPVVQQERGRGDGDQGMESANIAALGQMRLGEQLNMG